MVLTMFTDTFEDSSPNETFRNRLPDIIERWRKATLTKDDYEYLRSLHLSETEYINITETYGLRHGVELYDHRLVLLECPTSTHEVVIRRLEKLMDRTYQDELLPLGSSSNPSPRARLPWIVLIFLALIYANGRAKEADCSFIPVNMPQPSRNNGIKPRPNTGTPYPTFVIEIAISNEDRDRLLADAETKHFHDNTSIFVWLGINVRLRSSGDDFWMGWGRRRAIGYGLKLEEQTEDANGVATYLPVKLRSPLVGQLTIPSSSIFHPVTPPPTVSPSFVLGYEEIRATIEAGMYHDGR
jgi:hypothetical protein